jgi:hypothetical protein
MEGYEARHQLAVVTGSPFPSDSGTSCTGGCGEASREQAPLGSTGHVERNRFAVKGGDDRNTPPRRRSLLSHGHVVRHEDSSVKR